jgi:hypothetical protein
MYADLNFARVAHEDRRIRLEGAAGRHRLFHSLRQRHAVAAVPATVVGPSAPSAPLAVVRAEPAAPGRTPGAADRAA